MSDGIDRFERIPSLIPVREEALRHLAHAASDTSSPFRTVSVATIGHDGTPQVRTMMFRGFDPDAMTLDLYTDYRSTKVRGLEKSPDIQILMYDPNSQTQMRVSGTAELHCEDDVASVLWSNLPEYGRGDYLSRQPPGEQIAHPGDSWEDKTLGGRNFTVLRVSILSIDWLHLSGQGHRRALLTWDDGSFSARWLTP